MNRRQGCLGCGCAAVVLATITLVVAVMVAAFVAGEEPEPAESSPEASAAAELEPSVTAEPTDGPAPAGESSATGGESSATGGEKSARGGEASAKDPASQSSSAAARAAAAPVPVPTGAQSPRSAESTRTATGEPSAPAPESSSVSPSTTSAPAPTPAPSAAPSRTSAPAPAPEVAPTTDKAVAPARAAGSESGPVVKVVDGDTIDVATASGTERIRIIGLDTPEIGECGFSEASAAMADLVAGRSVQLVRDPTQDNRDRYGRLVRHVHRGGTSAAVEMIRRGHSAEYLYGAEYQNRSAHLRAEREARAAKVGMWSARGCATPTPTPSPTPTPTEPVTVVAPPEPTPTAPAPTGSCRIKGNISSSGEKIFHSPGQAHYERTKISLDKGERWFCSAADAVKAGWRAAKQ